MLFRLPRVPEVILVEEHDLDGDVVPVIPHLVRGVTQHGGETHVVQAEGGAAQHVPEVNSEENRGFEKKIKNDSFGTRGSATNLN